MEHQLTACPLHVISHSFFGGFNQPKQAYNASMRFWRAKLQRHGDFDQLKQSLHQRWGYVLTNKYGILMKQAGE